MTTLNYPKIIRKFLSTPSARRATLQAGLFLAYHDDFYPRPPRGGRLALALDGREILHISIHALREEGDVTTLNYPKIIRKFLSTPSARRATGIGVCIIINPLDFYPRPPRGGRRSDLEAEAHGEGISIHALREEGDPDVGCLPVLMLAISIHALREEGDSKNRDKISIFKQIIQHSARI